MIEPALRRLRIRVRGVVQGVGYRPFVHRLAVEHGYSGWVRNDEQGVLLELQGRDLEGVPRWLETHAPPLARVDGVEVEALGIHAGEHGFTIDASAHTGPATSAIGPDAGVCAACVEELCDPRARRFRYPFTNCTHCGPRYTITRALPYDRPNTSMASFALCADCEREYHDPNDRRFHAQPIACPACGPRLSATIEEIVRTLAAGKIVALKGLGGFQLLCDARDEATVAELRRRKQRDAKPFAVMVASVASAKAIVQLQPDELALLTSWQRPIVLSRKAPRTGLASSIAPELASLGVMLPTTPLHLLLFHEAAGRPTGTEWLERVNELVLVATSANPGGAPLVITDDEARSQLGGIADLIVTHDRPILVRNDDTVMSVVAGAPTFLRRARGYVPSAITLPSQVPPVLALGAQQKVTACLTRGAEAFVSQHVGDLDDAATFHFLEETIEHLQRTLEVTPVAVAHDLHPDFLSTSLAERLGLRTIAVQHHHAHLAAVLAEHGRRAPTIGLALDGFGLGTDGGSWGGELLEVSGGTFTRLGHLATLRQPGGDRAAREPWRMAAAALHRLGRADAIELRFPRHGAAVRQLLDLGVSAPETSSCGRLFDAACGLLGVKPIASYEGEAPMTLESLVTRPEVLSGTWSVKDGVLELLPLLDALIGRGPVDGANVFHGTLAAALVEWALPFVRDGVVALGGGCLMNRTLTELLVSRFSARGVKVLLSRRVPANDGGVSLGQAWVAAQSVEA